MTEKINEDFEVLSEETQEKFNVKIDYVLVHCSNPKCDWHWGINLSRRNTQFLTKRDLVCQHCAGDTVAEEK